jgi:hypothetical protein
MEQRHARTGLVGPGGLARRSLRQALPWFCLVVVLSTIAYGLHLAVASASSAVSGASAITALNTLVEDAIPPMRPDQVVVLVTSRDQTTGADYRVLCVTSRDRIATDVLVVTPQEFRDTEAALCGSGSGGTLDTAAHGNTTSD